MAKVRNNNLGTISGKTNKKAKEVHRVINGKEYVHTIENEYEGEPSAAQKLQRSIFGKTNAIVNGIMADPIQAAEWRERMELYNKSINPRVAPFPKRYKTLRKYIYAVISEQMKKKPAAQRRRAKLPITLPKGLRFQAKPFTKLSTAELYELLKARFSVFVGEQHIHYLDEDNIDYLATHYSIRKNGLVLAYARVFPEADKHVLRIGRMLTIERGKGYAKYLMARIIADAKVQGVTMLRLHAQAQTVPFYEHLGFHTVGNLFIEAEIPHVVMEMDIPNT
ncbi:MAG: GNAT family N-acetyltransferase [Paludibacteraceae bacterium]|nr:GNAT family N-acetyltransferase [Paludibacteraceae bacterium]